MSLPSAPVPAPPAPSNDLAWLNTHAVGYASLVGGGAGLSVVLVAVGRLFQVISDGGFVLTLYGEHRGHVFGPAHAQLVGLSLGIVGAVIVTAISGVGAYFARPKTIA